MSFELWSKAKVLPEAALGVAFPGWPKKGTMRLLWPVRQRFPIEHMSPDLGFLLPACYPEKATSLVVQSFHPDVLCWKGRRAGSLSSAIICSCPGHSKCMSSMSNLLSAPRINQEPGPPQPFLQQRPWQPGPSQRAHRATVGPSRTLKECLLILCF